MTLKIVLSDNSQISIAWENSFQQAINELDRGVWFRTADDGWAINPQHVVRIQAVNE